MEKISALEAAKLLGISPEQLSVLERQGLLHTTKDKEGTSFFSSEINKIKSRRGLTLSEQALQVDAQIQLETVSSISKFRKVFLATGALIGGYLLLVATFAILFFFYPLQTSDFFGYYYRPNTTNKPQASTQIVKGKSVLQASTGPSVVSTNQTSIVADLIKPAAAASLVAVKAVDAQKYVEIVTNPNESVGFPQTGILNLTGANGANGADGAPGPIGPQGLSGLAGANGTNGATGSTGATGANGTSVVDVLTSLGGIIIRDSANTTVQLSPGSNGQVLTISGGIPAWVNASSGSDFSSLASGTNTTASMVVGSGASLTPTGSGAITANAFSGLLPVANGGTGVGTLTTNGVLFGNGTGVVQATSGPLTGQILLGDGGGVPTFTTLTGDATVGGTGVLTLINTGTPGTYGSSLNIPVFVTDAQGRVTGVTNTTIAGLTTSNFTSANISQWTNNSGYITDSSTDTLTNKSISGLTNTFSNIPNSALTNSSLTVTAGTGLTGGGLVSLGGTTTLSLPSVGTAGTFGSGTIIPVITTDSQGRVASVTNTPISGLTAASLTAGDFSSVITSGTYSINITGNAATATSATSATTATTATNFTGSLVGDVTGTQGSTVVGKINGAVLGTTTATSGNLLIGSGTQWVTQALSNDATITSGGVLTLKNTGTPDTYGSALAIPVLTTDAQGRVTGVTNTTIAGLTTSNFTSANISQWTNNSGYITDSSTDTLTNKTIAAGSNTVTGLTNTNLSGTAGITNANLANSSLTVSTTSPLGGGGVVSLGGTLTLTCSTCLLTGGSIFTAASTTGSNSSISQGGTLTLAAGTNMTTTNNAAGTITFATVANPTFSGLVTASNGFTLTTGALNLTGTSGSLALSGLSASSINTGANALTFTSSNFNTTSTGINSTNIGVTTAGTGAFTTLSSTGSTNLGQGTGVVTLNSSGALNMTAALASTFTLANVANALNFDSNTLSIDALNNRIGIGVNNPSANLDIFSSDGTLRFGEAFPNKAGSTDNGISMYSEGTFKSGLFTEVNGELLSYGINVSQIGDRDTTKTGGIFRLDTRATSPYFSVKRQAIGGSTEFSDIQISQAGDIGFGGWASDTNSFPANVAILSRDAAVANLVLREASAQTADIMQWQNNAGTVLGKIDSAGSISTSGTGNITSAGNLVTSNQGIEFTESDTNPTCAAGDYRIYADTSEAKIKKCVNGVVSDVQAIPDMNAFSDTTLAATWTDSNTNELWDDATRPNITPRSSASEILVMVTVRGTVGSSGGGDTNNPVARVDRETGVTADCADTNNVGPTFGDLFLEAGGTEAFAINSVFVDNPGTTSNVSYTICSSSDSLSLSDTTTATRTDVTLFEINATADLAEIYPTNDMNVSQGDVVSIDPTLMNGVKLSSGRNDKNVLGIVATNPAMVMGNKGPLGANGVPVAMSGRVPVKISTENGAITAGDVLVAGSAPGTAMRATKAGTMIGLALESYDKKEAGTIMAFVKTGYYTGVNLKEIMKNEVAEGTSQSDLGKLALNKLLIEREELANATDFSEIMTDRVVAGLEVITPRVTTQDLISTRLFAMLDDKGNENVKISATGDAFFSGILVADTIRARRIEGFELFTDKLSRLTKDVEGISSSSAKPETIEPTNIVDQITKIASELFRSTSEFFGNVIFHADITFLGRPTFNKDTAGHALIKRGESEVSILFNREYANQPVVNISVNMVGTDKQDEAPVYAVYDLSTKGFKIKLSRVASFDLNFSWSAFAVDGDNVSKNPTVSNPPDISPSVTPENSQSKPETILPSITTTPEEEVIPTEEAVDEAVSPSPTTPNSP